MMYLIELVQFIVYNCKKIVIKYVYYIDELFLMSMC